MSGGYQKPPGLGAKYGAQFQDAAIVAAYRHREPYPEEVFLQLKKLCRASTPIIADLGCGPGDLTLPMSSFAARVDGVDFSSEMLGLAKLRAKEITNIRWIQCLAEAAPLTGPYDLITAADSVHWMDWDALFPRVKKWLKPGGCFCVVGRWYESRDWWTPDFQKIIDTYSTNKEFRQYDVIEELEKSDHVKVLGSMKMQPMQFSQPVLELVEAFHSRNGFSRERMGESAAHFDEAACAHLNKFAEKGVMSLYSSARITWMSVN